MAIEYPMPSQNVSHKLGAYLLLFEWFADFGRRSGGGRQYSYQLGFPLLSVVTTKIMR